MGKVITFASGTETINKSVMALLTASELARRGNKVVIVDFEFRDALLGFITGFAKPTVMTLRSSGINPSIISETVNHHDKLGVDVLLGLKRAHYKFSPDLPTEFFVDVIAGLKKEYDYVIIDSSIDYLDEKTVYSSYVSADQIVFVMNNFTASAFSLSRWIQEVAGPVNNGALGITREKLGIVVVNRKDNVGLDEDRINKVAMGIDILTMFPDLGDVFTNAINIQAPELLLKNNEFSENLSLMTDSIEQKLRSSAGNFNFHNFSF